jgi:hypothetical protein
VIRVTGKGLLLAAEDFVRKSQDDFNLVATTPAILDSANAFYRSRGFEVREEVAMGQLLMRTFVKINLAPS